MGIRSKFPKFSQIYQKDSSKSMQLTSKLKLKAQPGWFTYFLVSWWVEIVGNLTSNIRFLGQEYASYDFRGPLYNGPYPISRFVNSPDVDKVDAAFIWG